MKTLGSLNLLTSSAIYFAIALLIHAPVLADYLIAPAGREALIVNTALASATLTLQLLSYFLVVAVLNLLPLLLIQISFRAIKPMLDSVGISAISYFSITSLSFWVAVLVFNGIYFPRSAFTILIPFVGEDNAIIVGTIALACYVILAIIPAAASTIKYSGTLYKKPSFHFTIGVVLFTFIAKPIYSWETSLPSSTRPNIIIIGIDSLSPLHIEHNPGKLEFFEAILQNSTLFTNNITPLARTFPAWTSILTAKYPVNHGARFNLTPFDLVKNKQTLAHILKANGYTTIYAQDERKFNNIDEDFGFDTTVGPKLGAAEFILTKVSDHPLANLALLLPGSKYLFPFIALNRADHIHYDPESFVEATLKALPDSNNKPVFLATHFCLAHYPYTWRTQSRGGTEKIKNLPLGQQHADSLASLQKQIDTFLQGLKKRGRLENTLLIFLSDHGESLGYDDALWAAKKGNSDGIDPASPFYPRNNISGHGNNILDRTQYHSILAFKAFGALKSSFPTVKYNSVTSLVDITPTILSALDITYPDNMDGINLMNRTEKIERNKRTVITETGISFTSMLSITDLDESSILEEAYKYYTIDPESARLVVKHKYFEHLVSTKDIAIHTDDWMLALLRKNGSPPSSHAAILIHKPTGKWTNGANKSLIEKAPLALLANQLKYTYADEISDFQESWPFN
ncbi:MAG: sulfatase-like hydrolase/transferase [Gammaproteobacteria bacterium]|nr:sulfatase-like hydrolase/transferase [Gammaproteobacteria bacterium]